MRDYIFVSHEMGKFLKKKRKAKKLKQEDLSEDGIISTGTISNLEKGGVRVSKEKLEYLCKSLGTSFNDLLRYETKNKRDRENNSELQLMRIEHDLAMDNLNEGWEELKRMFLEKDDPHMVNLYFLKGKYYEKKMKWDLAQVNYLEAIHYIDQRPHLLTTNIKAMCYNGLGRIYTQLNNVDQALIYLEEGQNSFVANGERKHVYFHLLISKVIYLEKLHRYNEALLILEEMWEQIHQIDSTEIKLNMYQMRAAILNKLQLYDHAIKFAMEGIKKAWIDIMYDRSFELWSTLAESYNKKGWLEDAEKCFQTALQMENKVARKHIIPPTYTKLGLLYLEQGKIKQAHGKLEEAVRRAEKTNDVFTLIEAFLGLGESHLKQGIKAKAKRYLENAFDLASEHNLHFKKSEILIRLITCCKKDYPESYQKYVDEFLKVHLELREEGGREIMNYLDQMNTTQVQLGDPPPNE
ncbi:helix-turn-helix domain-containing protein [Paenactinomyces guangxiensis]|uniref:Tetratricopeptide repeat protein n=1 Tax=Paenactinomyces guangxiensis TaxID=1490290 RepID=A0A7W1WNC6_9BACL|nr:helix-turn-helix transcriptional regulator [Paenactinomyces guangxiensis]MBA4493090.1 tetratricopeptide repeat protein [Paenactinomyces guangxiensis]MBH8590060.1 tetratricopeptide repeat protein [Paenactinomyces guangxiensis]